MQAPIQGMDFPTKEFGSLDGKSCGHSQIEYESTRSTSANHESCSMGSPSKHQARLEQSTMLGDINIQATLSTRVTQSDTQSHRQSHSTSVTSKNPIRICHPIRRQRSRLGSKSPTLREGVTLLRSTLDQGTSQHTHYTKRSSSEYDGGSSIPAVPSSAVQSHHTRGCILDCLDVAQRIQTSRHEQSHCGQPQAAMQRQD